MSVTTLNYLEAQKEEAIILAKCEFLKNTEGKQIIKNMVQVANLTRNGFANNTRGFSLMHIDSCESYFTWTRIYWPGLFNSLQIHKAVIPRNYRTSLMVK